MRFPWANVGILFLGAAELVSGYLALTHGTPAWVAALHVHRILGFGLVALLFWKARNILPPLKNLRRWKRHWLPFSASISLLALLVTALGLGIVWSHIGPFHYLGISGVSWHIYLSLALAPPLVWHCLRHRWSLGPRFWAERRLVLRLGGLGLAGLALWQAGELANRMASLPGADRRFTGSYESGSDTGNGYPATSWLNDAPDPVDPAFWTLKVQGVVEHPLSFTYSDILQDNLADTEVRATLDCTGGWHSTQDWRGIPLKNILELSRVKPEAASITVKSTTGYFRRFSLDEAEEYLLATASGNESLSHRHGFPLRLVAPGKRGFEWVKWVNEIEVNDTSKWWQPPLPLT